MIKLNVLTILLGPNSNKNLTISKNRKDLFHQLLKMLVNVVKAKIKIDN